MMMMQAYESLPYSEAPDESGLTLNAFLPGPALLWFLILALVFPLVVIAGDSLLRPIVNTFWSILFPSAEPFGYAQASLLLVIKVIIFLPLAATSVGLLVMKILTAYHRAWTKYVPQPHPLHSAYAPHPQYSIISLTHWAIYRWARLLKDPLIYLVMTAFFSASFLLLMQHFSKPLALFFNIGFVVVIFALALCIIFLAMALFKSIRAYMKTCFGSTAAILEPSQPSAVLYERVQKICFNSPWVAVVYLQQFGFVAVLVFSFIYTTSSFDVQSFLRLEPGLIKLLFLNIIVALILLVLYVSKFFLYSDALSRFYEELE